MSATPGTDTVTVPATKPYTPALVIVSVAVLPGVEVKDARAVAPSEKVSATFLALTVKPPLVLVKPRSAVKLTPATDTVSPVPATDRASMPSNSRTTSPSPLGNTIVRLTAPVVWLRRTRIVPLTVTPARPSSSTVPRRSRT